MVLVLPRRGTSLSRIRRSALLLLRGALLIAAVTAASYWLHFNSASAALLYLVAVVLQSLDCGFLEAAVTSLLATASLDYYFIEPRFTFNVQDPLDVVTLAGLLIVSLVITKIQARSRAKADESRFQRNSMESLYKVGQELLALAPAAVAGPALLEPFVTVFELSAICVFDAATLECHVSGSSRGDLTAKTRHAFVSSQDAVYPDLQIVVRCLRARNAIFGAIGFEGLRDPELTAPALAALAAAALERARAFRSATAAAANAQAEMLRSAILDALAHEFKTPLATILTAAGGLRAAGTMQPQQAELAEMIEVEASRLGDLTSRLLPPRAPGSRRGEAAPGEDRCSRACRDVRQALFPALAGPAHLLPQAAGHLRSPRRSGIGRPRPEPVAGECLPLFGAGRAGADRVRPRRAHGRHYRLE